MTLICNILKAQARLLPTLALCFLCLVPAFAISSEAPDSIAGHNPLMPAEGYLMPDLFRHNDCYSIFSYHSIRLPFFDMNLQSEIPSHLLTFSYLHYLNGEYITPLDVGFYDDVLLIGDSITVFPRIVNIDHNMPPLRLIRLEEDRGALTIESRIISTVELLKGVLSDASSCEIVSLQLPVSPAFVGWLSIIPMDGINKNVNVVYSLRYEQGRLISSEAMRLSGESYQVYTIGSRIVTVGRSRGGPLARYYLSITDGASVPVPGVSSSWTDTQTIDLLKVSTAVVTISGFQEDAVFLFDRANSCQIRIPFENVSVTQKTRFERSTLADRFPWYVYVPKIDL